MFKINKAYHGEPAITIEWNILNLDTAKESLNLWFESSKVDGFQPEWSADGMSFNDLNSHVSIEAQKDEYDVD